MFPLAAFPSAEPAYENQTAQLARSNVKGDNVQRTRLQAHARNESERNSMQNKAFAIATSLLCLVVAAASQQQDKSKRPSPPAKAEVVLKGKTITIDYSRPYAKGRKIIGGIVPFNQVWRTGANEATTFTTPIDLTVGDAKVPAGTYTLYSLPSANGWKLIINKQTGQWGTEYDEKQDLARVDMQTGKTAQPVEQFTISFQKKGDDAATLVMEWENTSASVAVKAQ